MRHGKWEWSFYFVSARVMDMMQNCVAPDIDSICGEARVEARCIRVYVVQRMFGMQCTSTTYGQSLDFDTRSEL